MSNYTFDSNSLKYFLNKLKEKFALKSEGDNKVDRVILQEEVPARLWINEQLKYGNSDYFIEEKYFNSFDCIKIEIDSKIYDKNDFDINDSNTIADLEVGDLYIEISNDSYGDISAWWIYVNGRSAVEGRPVNSAYITIESQHIPGIEKKLVSNDYTDEHKNLNGNLINNVSVDKTDTEYTLVFNNTNNIETTISIPYDKYKKSALFVDCNEEFHCVNGEETIIPFRYLTSINEKGSEIIIEKTRNGEIIKERFDEKGDTAIVPFPLDTEVELPITSLKDIVSLRGKSLEEEILDNYGVINYENNTAHCTFGTVYPFSIKPNSNGNLVFFFNGVSYLNSETSGNYKAGDYYRPDLFYLIYNGYKDLITSYTYIPHIDDTEIKIYAIDPEGTKTGITYLKPIISEPAIFSYDFKTSYNYAAPIFNDEVEYTYEETINGDKTYVTITISNPSELTSIDISSWHTYSVYVNISTLDLTNCENLNYIKVPNINGYSRLLSEFLPTRPSSSPGTMHAPILTHGFNTPECFNRGWIYTYDKLTGGGGEG